MDDFTCTIVRAKWNSSKARWLPVRLPLHSDLDLSFPARHWHVDYRFLKAESDARDLGMVVGSPVMLRLVVPEPYDVDYLTTRDVRWSEQGHKVLRLHEKSSVEERAYDRLVATDLRRFPLRSWMRKARWKQRRTYEGYAEGEIRGAPLLRVLSRLGSKLPGCEHMDLKTMRCPHRNVDLSDVEPIDGVIQCPLHGLRFCAKTGERMEAL